MHKVRAKLALVAAMAAALLAGTLLQGDAQAGEQGKLQVWINGDKAYNGLAEIGKRFTKDTGIPVLVEHPQDAPGKFQQAAASGKGPDVFFWAHDRAGEWVQAGLIEPIKPKSKFRRQFEKVGWDAYTFNGQLYGYPLSLETIGLIYNKELIKKPPKSFEEIFALHKKLTKNGKRAILWDYTNTYFTWPLIAANGGYVFKRDRKGNYDIKDVGVNNRGALRGVNMLIKLIQDGVMPKSSSYSAMESAMNKGELAMMISGAWAWQNLQKSNINFGVAPIPAINGKPSKPFIGVQGAMINRASPNKELAIEFLENYVYTEQGLATLNNDVPLGVPAHKSFARKLAQDPHVRATIRNIKNGVLMPSVPEMGRFWSAMESALQNVTQGRQTPKEALDSAAKRILN